VPSGTPLETGYMRNEKMGQMKKAIALFVLGIQALYSYVMTFPGIQSERRYIRESRACFSELGEFSKHRNAGVQSNCSSQIGRERCT
jgi:hypothetical protein